MTVEAWMRQHPKRRRNNFDKYAPDILRMLREDYTYAEVAQMLWDVHAVGRDLEVDGVLTRGPVTDGAIRLWVLRRSKKKAKVDAKGAAIAANLGPGPTIRHNSPAAAPHPNIAAHSPAAPPAEVRPAPRIAPGVPADLAAKLAIDMPVAVKPISTDDLLERINRGENPLPNLGAGHA